MSNVNCWREAQDALARANQSSDPIERISHAAVGIGYALTEIAHEMPTSDNGDAEDVAREIGSVALAISELGTSVEVLASGVGNIGT